MTERAIQFSDGTGNIQANNGSSVSVTNILPPEPTRPTRAVHLNPPPALFIGREPELAALHQHLARECAVVYIPGMPGRGKSTLANFYAHQHKDEYQTVHWLPCHSKSLVEIAAEFAWQLELKLDGDLEANLKQFRAHCARNRCLLILDNVDDEAPAGMLLGGRSSVLLTTWHTNLKFLRPVPAIPLPVFTEDQCLELFHAKLDAKLGAAHVDRHADECRLLFHRLEFHPKALDLVAHLIREVQQYTIAGMAKNLPKDIPALFDEAVAALSPNARALLVGMAACAPEGFRLSLASEAASALPPSVRSLLACGPEDLVLAVNSEFASFDEDTAFVALNELCSRSLVDELDRDTHRYRLHTLVRDVAQPTDALRFRHAEAVLAQFRRWEVDWRRCEEDLSDWRTAFAWSVEQPGYSAWATASGLAYTGYSLAERVGRLAEAHEICASMARRAEARGDTWRVPAWLGNQALILKAWGRLHEAMICLKNVEALCLPIGNKNLLAASYGSQASIFRAWGRLDEAMALLERREALCDELGDKAALAGCYGDRAVILQVSGRLHDAMSLHKKVEILYGELGLKAGLKASYGNQAAILADWGRLDEAMTLHQREEALCNELGDKAGLAICFGNQALILKAWGKLDDAMALHHRQEALCDELGDKAGLAGCYANQGLLARERGDWATERDKLQQALNLFTELGMPDGRDQVQKWLNETNGISNPESS